MECHTFLDASHYENAFYMYFKNVLESFLLIIANQHSQRPTNQLDLTYDEVRGSPCLHAWLVCLSDCMPL